MFLKRKSLSRRPTSEFTLTITKNDMFGTFGTFGTSVTLGTFGR